MTSLPPLVAVGGNPNVGKTTLFNVLTASRARVGNYPGVTVERRLGHVSVPGLGVVDVVDVPGTYSLVARTGEEQIALASLLGIGGERAPDVIILCVDATQLVRGLYLVLQAQEFGLPVVVALTMVDEAGAGAPDAKALEEKLGCPVVPVVASKGRGLGDCGSQQQFAWDGARLRLVDQRDMGECRQVTSFIPTWRAQVVVR